MKLTVHRGTKEIGGSCIELATANTRIILDVGLPLVMADREPFDSGSIEGKSVDEMRAAGIIPNVPGLFDGSSPPNAIVLSHSHLDHSGLLHLTDPSIPIYASRGTSKLMLAGAVFSRQRELDRSRHHELIPGQPVTIGDFRITPFSVDHSAFGSMAILIEGPDKTVLYSGDLRLHGRKPGMMKALVDNIRKTPIDVLLMEGTHFGGGRETGPSEFDVEEDLVHHARTAPGLVLACFSPLDVDRLVTYYRVSQRTGRTFVVDGYAAFVLHMVASEANIPRPIKAKGIRVYFNQAFDRKNIETLKNRFEPDRITPDEIKAEPSKHLMVFRPSMTALDFNGVLPSRSRCCYSYWSGYLKNPDWVELQRQLTEVSGDFIQAHASGHIYVNDLVEFVKAVNPARVVPIHTFEPQRFRENFSNTILLNDGEPHEL